MKYTLIKYDGKITTRCKMSLKQMQDFVGGYIEKVGDVFCNEDGRRLNLPINVFNPVFVGNIIVRTKDAVTRAYYAMGRVWRIAL